MPGYSFYATLICEDDTRDFSVGAQAEFLLGATAPQWKRAVRFEEDGQAAKIQFPDAGDGQFGPEVELYLEGRVRRDGTVRLRGSGGPSLPDGRWPRLDVTGVCDTIDIVAAPSEAIGVYAAAREIHVDAGFGGAYVNLYSDHALQRDSAIRSETFAWLTVAERMDMNVVVPEGWTIMCLGSTNPLCGQPGPLAASLGRAGKTLVLDAPRGVLLLVGERPTDPEACARGLYYTSVLPDVLRRTNIQPACSDIGDDRCLAPWNVDYPPELPWPIPRHDVSTPTIIAGPPE